MTQLYEDNQSIMYRQAIKILGRCDHVEDVVADACVALIGKVSLIRAMDRYTLRAYIVSTVRNTAINFIARRDRQGRHFFLDDGTALDRQDSGEEEALKHLIRREEIDRLKAAIRMLSENERLALTMKYLDEMNDREIAQTLSIKEDSVRSCLMRARRHVKQHMKE